MSRPIATLTLPGHKYPILREQAAAMRKGLDGLRLPPARYRPNIGPTSKMESAAEAAAEDRLRVKAARKTLAAEGFRNGLTSRDVRLLIRRLKQSTATKRRRGRTLASLVTMRWYRVRIIGQLLSLLAKHPSPTATRVDIAPKSWNFTPEELLSVDPRRLLQELRAALNRDGAGQADGYLFLYLEAEFASHRNVFRIHVHGLAAGGMIQVIDRLRKRKNFKRIKPEPAPVRIRRKQLRALFYLLTYIMKGDWFGRWEGVNEVGAKIRSGRQRVEEPFGTLFRTWLNRWSIDDLCLRLNLTIAGGEFQITDCKAYKKGGRS